MRWLNRKTRIYLRILVISNNTLPVRQYKDSVFRDLFSKKWYLLQMYKTLHPEDITAANNDWEIITLAKCIDNDPMEGFWGILKREGYYGRRFTDKESLVNMIEKYIRYYNNKRLQRNLGIMTPMEKHEIYQQAT